jgi:transcriptional regulator with XRE-family HTH domain
MGRSDLKRHACAAIEELRALFFWWGDIMRRGKNDTVTARRADSHDQEVGRRVRARRLECRISQTELANKCGVTFQQVQKYEKGVNRIGASRLERIASALEVPVTFFFDGSSSATPRRGAPKAAESVFDFVQTSGAVRVVKAFHSIKSRKSRQLLVQMCEQLADGRA